MSYRDVQPDALAAVMETPGLTIKLAVLEHLISSGADPGIRTDDGYNALDSASTIEVLKYLRPLLRNTG